MNKTKIDWADCTWNPVTGCMHGCEYCYARKIAERFGGFRQIGHIRGPNADLEEKYVAANGKVNPFPYGFTPTFHRYRINEPSRVKEPQTIFVCSMADLFGEWVPDEWIQEVFKACDAAPQHRYLFLTKNPKRYERVLDRYFPPNMWFGWSQDGPMGDALNFKTHHSVQTFVSIEPLLRPFEAFSSRGIEWAIVGAESGNRKGKVIPKKSWVDDIASACSSAGIPLFMKESLRVIMGDDFKQEYPF